MKGWTWIVVAAGVAGAGVFLARDRFNAAARLPDGLIQATGRIEGDQVRVVARVGGRIGELLVREGSVVAAGEAMLRLDDPATMARLDHARAARVSAEARVNESRGRLAAAQSRLSALETAIGVMRKELPIEMAAARAAVEAAEASIKGAAGVEELQRADYTRKLALRERNVITQAEIDETMRMLLLIQEYVNRSRMDRVKAEAAVEMEQLGPERLKAKEAELKSLADAVVEATAAVAAAEAVEQEAQAAVAGVEADVADLVVVAPTAGVVSARMVNPGELVAARQPLYEIVDLASLRMRVYLSGPDVGRLAIGNSARLYTDAFPEAAVEAAVSTVSPVAEFTPKDVATPDERVKLVYAVELAIRGNEDGRLKPGMPADAVIRWRPDAEWVRPQW